MNLKSSLRNLLNFNLYFNFCINFLEQKLGILDHEMISLKFGILIQASLDNYTPLNLSEVSWSKFNIFL